MGNCVPIMFKKLRRKRSAEKDIVLLLVGLDNAGKTLVLNHISGDTDYNVLPTMGFRMVSLRYKSYHVKVYDLGGSPQIRSIWPKYYSDVHGLIYVVDASDISRLTENRITFGELISNEHISGKPLLLLANKQDLSGAVDELDLVENLDVERVANVMRCPTRVETCSCFYVPTRFNGTQGIINGYKWLLDAILKNYNVLNSRIKVQQNHLNGFIRKSVISTDTPSKSLIYSDPFKPIHELVLKQKRTTSPISIHSEDNGRSTFKRLFPNCKNKTAPVSLGHRKSKSQFALNQTDNECDIAVFKTQEHKQIDQTNVITLEPLRLELQQTESKPKLHRPFTAPQSFQNTFAQATVFNIPGQVHQCHN